MATTMIRTSDSVSTMTLSVKSDVVAPYKYQWKRNGVNLGGSQWVSLTIPNVTADDRKAKWSVTVYGQDGAEESTATVLTAIPQPIPTPPVAHPVAHQGAGSHAAPGDLAAKGFTPAQLAGVKGK